MQSRALWLQRQTFGVVAAFVMSFTAFAAGAAEKSTFFNESGVAIRGYDPVAYFTQAKAVEGEAAITHTWQGATWRFANAANRDRFAADPERYAPQYGGYCAYAASKNYIAPTDPHAWTVHNDKLYLNYSKSVRKRWSKDIPGNISLGDANWPALMGKL